MTLIKGKLVKKKKKPESPQQKGERSISGHMAGLESDDNALDAVKKIRYYPKKLDSSDKRKQDEK